MSERADATESLDGRTFRSVSNTPNGEVGDDTRFHYRQQGSLVTATYAGGRILAGQMIGTSRPDGRLDLRYHHLNDAGELMAGECLTTIGRLADGRLILKEQWRWFSGDGSSGTSEVVEVRDAAE